MSDMPPKSKFTVQTDTIELLHYLNTTPKSDPLYHELRALFLEVMRQRAKQGAKR